MSSEPRERTLELDRLVNFSDAVFAIAATVLVLSISFSLRLKQPDLDRKLWHEFGDVLPQVVAYALSFFIIARFFAAMGSGTSSSTSPRGLRNECTSPQGLHCTRRHLEVRGRDPTCVVSPLHLGQ